MGRPDDEPRFVDQHQLEIAAPRERVWAALRRYVDVSLTGSRRRVLGRLLGTRPASGFEVSGEDVYRQISLSGRHRFSRYRLVFELADVGDRATVLTARSYADFPGPLGRVYAGLVLGTRIHVLAVRRMLRSVRDRLPD